MERSRIAGLIAIGLLAPTLAAEQLSQADLLQRVIDLDRLTTPPAGERTGMFTSFDRASKINEKGEYLDWDANGDAGKFLREEEGGWRVMAEMAGPGAITRIWSANPHGQIRVLLDGQTVIDAPFADLFNGKLAPFAAPLAYVNPSGGGQNNYFPIGYGRSCKVVLKDGFPYYQINYVTFRPGTTVATFTAQLDDAAAAALEQVNKALTDGLSERQLFGGRRTASLSEQRDLKHGETLGVSAEGAGCVRALYVALTDRSNPSELYALHNCVLRIFFDGEKDPAVECPLIDFFGSGFDLVRYLSLPIGTDKLLDIPLDRPTGEDRFFYCYFPMPFSDGARFEIENRSGQKIGFMFYLRIDRTPPAGSALRFRARFRTEDPCQVLDYPILETAGLGRIVGCVLNVDCPRAAWWGEGDDKVWIDGETFPSYFGTGSEDYIGDAWGLRRHVQPFQGVTRTWPYGKNSAYRWHIDDCIDFEKSVRFTIENWQHDRKWDAYYATIAYWYGPPGAKHSFQRLKPEDLTLPPLRIPGAVEIEGHVRGPENWGNIVKEKTAGAEFSSQQAVSISTNEPVQITIPSDEARTVRLKLRTNPRRTFDTITVEIPGGRTIGTVGYRRDARGYYDVGLLRLAPGDNTLNVRCSRAAMLDCWILEPAPRSGAGPEGEDLRILSITGARATVEDAEMNWSGGSQLAVDFAAPEQSIKLALPEQKEDRLAAITLVVTRGPAGGRVQTLVDDQPLRGPVDLYAAEARIERVPLGTVHLAKGAHAIAFKSAEGNPASTGARLGLDCIDLYPVRSPYAIEAENLKPTGFEGTNHEIQPLGSAYSGGAHLWCKPTAPGAWIELEVPVEKSGRYKVSIVYTTSFDYGKVQTSINGEPVGEAFDTFGALKPGPIRELGVFDLPAGTFKLRVDLVGRNETSPGFYFGVDCVILEPAP